MADLDFMKIPLCSECKNRSGIYDFDHTTPPCSRFPDAKSLKDARTECNGEQWVKRPQKVIGL